MFLEGSYIISKEPVRAAKVLFYGHKTDREVILLDENGNVLSAYKQIGNRQFMAYSDVASKLTARVNKALTKIRKSGGEPTSYNDIPALEFHTETRTSTVTIVSDRYTVYKVDIDMDVRLHIAMTPDGEERRFVAPPDIRYVELSTAITTESGQEIIVRSVEEIKLTKKDVSWLEKYKGIVVQEDDLAERCFRKLEETSDPIAYDTETTGLKINCFGKINSEYARALAKYNEEHADKIYADRLCGIIFATKTDTAVYFPCFSRKFKVLYQEDTPTRRMVVDRIRADYTVGRYRDRQGDMAEYIRNGGEMTPDIILMERVRYILENKYIIAHNASFEYKVGFMYDIITNIRDDTMLLHQILYRYGPDPRHRLSNLKALSKLELGIDQWGLEDFFPAYKEEEDARLRTESQVGRKKKKNKVKIDFSYMDLEGAKIYAPADGYCTMGLWQKYKKDLKENWPQMERIYLVEVSACLGVAYCEFYGHRLDETQIEKVKQDFIEQTAILESKIRAEAQLCQAGEDLLRTKLELARMKDSEAEKLSEDMKALRAEALSVGAPQLAIELKELMAMDVFNIGSSKQLCDLFYDKMGIPETSKGRSVAKDAIKALLDHKHPDGSLKYPIVKLYQEWKAADTLLTKFFDNLSDYMWPGGFIFSSYGQIAAATGRMSCIAEGQLITLSNGARKRIENIRPGDKVFCFDDKTLMPSLQPVLEVVDRGRKECVEVRWKSECNQGSVICTPDHLIRTIDGNWVRADELKAGDELHHFSYECDWSDHVVVEVLPAGVRHVYDLAISEHHNFIASGINVHNCKQPNAQQYPKAITKIVIPRKNCVMMDADFSQIEYRVLVALAQEPALLQKFYDPDIDYHTMMASLMFSVPYEAVTPAMRSDAKRFNFGIPYGMGIGSIAMGLFGENTPKTREMAKAKRKLYFKEQPRVEQFFERVKEAAVLYGFTETAFKRRRYYTFTSADSEKARAAKASAMRQAGNAVIQGTAADIFKIALSRSMRYIIKNGLFGKVFLTNMVHDELLWEIDVTQVNPLVVTTAIGEMMSFYLDGFPPLYIGAGVSNCWAKAKSKDCEIHPVLLEAMTKEVKEKNLDVHTPTMGVTEWLAYFDERVMSFRKDKIIAYLTDSANIGQNVHPEIGNLIRMMYQKYISEDGINPKDPGADAERTLRCIEYLSEKYELGLDRNNYMATGVQVAADDKADSEYEDDEDAVDDGHEASDSDFEIIDEDKIAGVRLVDLIREFAYVVAPSLKVCGIDDSVLTQKKREDVYGFLLNNKQCGPDDEGALELVLHIGGGVLKHTNVYVNNIGTGAEIEQLLS